jgi:hypothetical protein
MTLAAMTVVFFLIPAVALYSELSKRSDIWWTPRPLAVPLTESADRIQVFVRAKPIGSLLDSGSLRVVDDGSTSALTASDIRFRFNNWDRVRAQRLPVLLFYAAFIGAGVLLFFLLVTGRIAYQGEGNRDRHKKTIVI